MLPLRFYIGQWKWLPSPPSGTILDGKTVIITGSNGGIGFATALQVAACSPAHLILAVRNLASGAEALKKILKKYPHLRVDVWELDVSSFASVKAFAARANKELDKVDILINNAGQDPGNGVKPLNRTQDGHEQTIQVNVLSPVFLSLLLQPQLAKSSDPRIIFVSSEVHSWCDPGIIEDATRGNTGGTILQAFNDDARYDITERYRLSRLLLQMLVRKLIPALPSVRIIAVNPGLCLTDHGRDFVLGFNLSTIYMLSWVLLNARSANTGAKNTTSAVLNAKDSVEYWSDCRPEGSPSTFLGTGTGFKATEQFWTEVLEELESVLPGCTKSLKVV